MNEILDPQSTDASLQPISRAYIVHDRRTGKVLHIHHSVTFSQPPPQREAPEARARRLAAVKESAHLAILEVDSEEIAHGLAIKVDVSNQRVVRIKSRPAARKPKRRK